MITISRIEGNSILDSWILFRKEIEKAISTIGDESPDYELAQILTGNAIMYGVYEDKEIKAVLVIRIMQSPVDKRLLVSFVAGKDRHEWKDAVLLYLDRLRFSFNCDAIEVRVRPAGRRELKNYGYSEVTTTMVKK